MESQRQKWVSISYLALAVLVGYLFFTFGLKLSSNFDWEASVRNIDLVLRIGAIVVAALIFFLLNSNAKANQFMGEVVAELSQVTWPTQRETVSATFVVIVTVLIAGVILGLLDYFWTTILQWILKA